MTETGPPPSPPPAPQRLDPAEPGDLSGRLFPPLATEAEWSLDRVRSALDELDRPHGAYRTLHVGGTNGKGSVAAVWAAVLREAGSRVGLYTSPHLVEFNERFRIDDRSVDDETLLAAAAQVRAPVVDHGLTFFEAVTVLAFHLFRTRSVDVAVVEVGLGGRLDSTNVIRPEVCAVTNVGLDHAEYLGDTLEDVAREKAGIAKRGVPFITGERRSDVVAVLEREAVARGAPFHRLDAEEVIRDSETGISGSRFRLATDAWGEISLKTSLVGRHQVENVALAVGGLDRLGPALRPEAGAVVRGVERTRWPGRLQVEPRDGRTWIFDVAHNPEATRSLLETLRMLDLPEPRALLFGCLGDKDWRSMLALLRGWGRRAILVEPPDAPRTRAWDPRAAARSYPDWAEGVDLVGALDRAEALAGAGGTVLVTGSHRLVGAGLAALGHPPFADDPDGTEDDAPGVPG